MFFGRFFTFFPPFLLLFYSFWSFPAIFTLSRAFFSLTPFPPGVMRATGMVQDDILQTLASLGWSRDEPADASARLHVVVNVDQAARVVSEYERRNVFRVNDECLRWTPPHP